MNDDEYGFRATELLQRSLDLRRRSAHADVQFSELSLADVSRRIHHKIRSRLSFRESNYVANTVRRRHEHRQAIEPEGNTAVRRCAKLQRIQQETELLSCLLRRNTQQAENSRLQFLMMNTHR